MQSLALVFARVAASCASLASSIKDYTNLAKVGRPVLHAHNSIPEEMIAKWSPFTTRKLFLKVDRFVTCNHKLFSVNREVNTYF